MIIISIVNFSFFYFYIEAEAWNIKWYRYIGPGWRLFDKLKKVFDRNWVSIYTLYFSREIQIL